MIEIVDQLSIELQNELLEASRQIVREAPLFIKTMPTGAAFRYSCTSAGEYGWVSDRKGYRYEREHPVTGRPFAPIPPLIDAIARRAALLAGLSIEPQSVLLNWYGTEGKLGLHQDNTERCDAPVISISLGDDCAFVIGGAERSAPTHSIRLRSGDVLVMGAAHRLIFHGVRRIYPGTAPAALALSAPGRVNLTVRQVDEVITSPV